MKFHLLLALSTAFASAQVRVNEFMASNTRSVPDITDFEDYPDWIELHNPDVTEVSLDGYFLSDDPGEPFKWPIPVGATIPAGGYLLFMADGNDAAPGESHPRGYWPWRNFTTEKYHTNFSLSADGESVVLTRAVGQTSTTFIPAGSTWKYLDDGSSQSTQWRTRTYNDATWAEGPAPLGYENNVTTTISFGGDEDNKHITSYFRHTFNVVDPSIYTDLTVGLLVDDGAAVYLNGQEIIRDNLPGGTLTSSTFASGSTRSERDYTTFDVPPSALVAGDNVIAIEVHQHRPGSSDLSIDLSLAGLSYTSVNTLDTINYGTSVTDISYGRDETTPAVWQHYAEPTPGAPNLTAVVANIRLQSDDATILPAAGFYTDPQNVTLSTSAGEIRYTLDGSSPTSASLLYTGPIPISTTTIVRARVFESGKVPGPIATQTYFYGEAFNGLPIISVVADPETLFGDEIGIYDNDHEPVRDGMNEVYKGKDAPGHLEFFPLDSSAGFAVNSGIRIGGENNWASHDQKTLNFSLRGKYGDDNIKYDLFPGSGIPNHSALTLREGGDDWEDAMLRDGMWDAIATGFLDVETTYFRPSVVFLNGDYWGVYNIRSRWNEEWLFEKYGVNNGDYDHVGYGRYESTSTTLGAQEGDVDDWLDLLAFIDNNDVNDPAAWEFVKSRVELDSFIDFIVAESFSNNTSWRHNREFWKSRQPGSKWRWFIPDMDRTFKASAVDANVFDDMLRREDLLDRLKDQPEFKARLAQRFAAHISATFAPSRIEGIVDSLGALITPELARHKAKWPGSIDAAQQARDLQEIKDFTTRRSTEIHTEISSELEIGRVVDLTLATTGQGTVYLAGVPVSSGSIPIFPNLDAKLTAVSAPGYQFDSWTGINGPSTTTLNTSGAIAITANFIPAPGTVTGGTLAANSTFTAAGSPYTIMDDLIVPAGITLNVEAGVTLKLAAGRHIRVMGTLNLQGTEGNEIILDGCHGESWGGVSFEETTTTSFLDHVIVRNATRGEDPTRYPSAISGLNSVVDMDFVDISDCLGPLFFRGGETYLRDSLIQIPITGDGINVKTGYAETWRTTFLGNNAPDTDAIDYDGVVNGIIKDCRIYNFRGFNSDGIDTGEQCVDVLIEGNGIYFNSDKGISVGQGSSVILRKNIIVGCLQGVGVKDFGSYILIDQNTLVDCEEGVAVFEKNFGRGGGAADVTNTIISGSTIPVSVDSLSLLSTNYNLSDTVPLFGTGNLFGDPGFVDASQLNFELLPSSQAIDSGDPAHDPDPDATRVDMGAAYVFQENDYPYPLGKRVVVNEVLSNSGALPDWIELYNRTSDPVDIGGWFLSDSASDLAKYRIPVGTTIPAGGFITFFEDVHFGPTSNDPNRITAFALSDDGETVYLSSAENDQLTDYRFKEDFGASFPGETHGYYYKASSDSFNFLPLSRPTVNEANASPRIGPIVISEVMYNPAGSGDAEYLELLNVSDENVTFFDRSSNTAWRFTSGIEYEFPAVNPVTLLPGERLILTRNIPAFMSAFSVPKGTQILEWTNGGLSNGGEVIQLGRPGPLDASNFISFVRVDRVKYDDSAPWPADADGLGLSLTKIAEKDYGNDFINWSAMALSPGDIAPGERFDTWAAQNSIANPLGDEDGDGLIHLLEYAFDLNPNNPDSAEPLTLNPSGSTYDLAFEIDLARPDVDIVLQESPDLINWTNVSTVAGATVSGKQTRSVSRQTNGTQMFHRLQVSQKP